MQETLGQEDHLEKNMATHYIILAWEIPWTEDPGGLQGQTQLSNWTTSNTSVLVLYYLGEDFFKNLLPDTRAISPLGPQPHIYLMIKGYKLF